MFTHVSHLKMIFTTKQHLPGQHEVYPPLQRIIQLYVCIAEVGIHSNVYVVAFLKKMPNGLLCCVETVLPRAGLDSGHTLRFSRISSFWMYSSSPSFNLNSNNDPFCLSLFDFSCMHGTSSQILVYNGEYVYSCSYHLETCQRTTCTTGSVRIQLCSIILTTVHFFFRFPTII